MTFEHSRKQQNVGYTDTMIGCSLKQPITVFIILTKFVNKG